MEIEEMKRQGMRMSSWKAFNRHVNILMRFAKEVRPYDYEDIDWNFRLEMIDWLTKENNKLAYGNKTLSILRQFLERARRQKFHSNIDYQGSSWMVSAKKAKGQIVILTPEELQKLNNVPILSLISQKTDTPAKVPLNLFPWLMWDIKHKEN